MPTGVRWSVGTGSKKFKIGGVWSKPSRNSTRFVNDRLITTLADATAFLEAEGITYALIGGMAVSLLGQPRFTADVDIVIAADVDRALKIGRAHV